MAKVSIIVPIYNSEKYIKKCIESLLNQTYEDYELLLINDGSTDITESIIDKYDDDRIKYYKTDNQGIGKARNYGLEKSKGKYIVFVDSDDYVEKNMIESLVNKIESDDLDIAICDYYKKTKNRIKKEKLISFSNTSISNNEEILLNINLSVWNKIFKKSLITKNKLKFKEDIRYEDIPFVLDALMLSNKVGKVDKFLYYFVIHEGSETSRMDEKVFDILYIYKDILNKYKDQYKDTINKLAIKELTNYSMEQRKQMDKEQREKFVNEVFDYFEKEIPDYKKNKYSKKSSLLNKSIGKSRKLSLLYCNLCAKFKKRKIKEEQKKVR